MKSARDALTPRAFGGSESSAQTRRIRFSTHRLAFSMDVNRNRPTKLP